MSNVSSDDALKRPLSQVENGSIKKNRSNSDTDRSRLGMSKDTPVITTDGQAEDVDGSEAETVVMPGKELEPRASTKKTIRHENSSGHVSTAAESVKSDGHTNGLSTRTRPEGGNSSDRKVDKTNNTTESQHPSAVTSPSQASNQHRSRSRATSESTRVKEDHNDGVKPGPSRKRKGSMDGHEDKSVKRRIKRDSADTVEHRKPNNHDRSESPTRQRGSTASSNPGSVQKAKRKTPAPLVVTSAGSKGKDHADAESNESQSPRRSAPPRVSHYGDVTKRRDKNGRTRVARACAMGHLYDLREWLEDHPEELDEADNAGNTPLQIASLQGETDIVRLLLKKGAKFDTENCDKDSPLIDAVENSHIDVVRMLLEAGVNPRKVNAKGEEAADLVDMEHVNGPAVKEELARYRIKYDSKRRKSTEKAPDTSKESIANRSPRDSPSTTTRSPPPQTTRRRAGRSEATRNDLLWTTATPENLVNFAGKGDEQAIMHLLNMRPVSDVEAVFAAAKGGHDSCLNLLLAMGQTDQDPAPLEDQKKGYNTPMLVAIGKGNVRVIELLLEQKDFDPTRRMYKNMTYYEVAEKRQGDGWKDEYKMLKTAYDERVARDGKKSSTKSSRTSSPKDSKKAPRERSPSTNVRDASPSATKTSLLRKKSSTTHDRDIKSERSQEKARVGHIEKKPDRKHLKVPKHESREGSAATSDREPSPTRDRDRKSASDQELPRPRKRLVSGKDLRDAQNKQRRNSLVSVKSVGSTQELAKTKSSPEDVVKARHRDLEARKEKKRLRKSVSPQPSDRTRSPVSTLKRHRNVIESSESKSSTGTSRVSTTTRPNQSAGSAPVALMGSPTLGKKELKASAKDTIHVASEDRASALESSGGSKTKAKERSSKMSSNKMDVDMPKSKDSKSHGLEHLSIKEENKTPSQDVQSSLIKNEEPNSSDNQETTDLPVKSELSPEDNQPKPIPTPPAPDIEMSELVEESSSRKRSFSEMEQGSEQPEQSEEPTQTIIVSAPAEVDPPITAVLDQDTMMESEPPEPVQLSQEQPDEKQIEEERIAREEAIAHEAEEEREKALENEMDAYVKTLPKALEEIMRWSSKAKKPESLKKWLPLVCALGSEVDPNCPQAERDELWIPNYQATALLVDSGLRHHLYPDWTRKPMDGLVKELAWRATKANVFQFYARDVVVWANRFQESNDAERLCKQKWEAMLLYWIRLSDFQSVVPDYEHLNGIELRQANMKTVAEHEQWLRGIEERRSERKAREAKRKAEQEAQEIENPAS